MRSLLKSALPSANQWHSKSANQYGCTGSSNQKAGFLFEWGLARSYWLAAQSDGYSRVLQAHASKHLSHSCTGRHDKQAPIMRKEKWIHEYEYIKMTESQLELGRKNANKRESLLS